MTVWKLIGHLMSAVTVKIRHKTALKFVNMISEESDCASRSLRIACLPRRVLWVLATASVRMLHFSLKTVQN